MPGTLRGATLLAVVLAVALAPCACEMFGSDSSSGSDSGGGSGGEDPPGPPPPTPQDYDLHAGGLWANILGQSGKIDLAPSPDPSNHPDRIRIQIEALRELDAGGTKIGSGGNIKHSFNSFATQSFTFGNMMETTYGDSGVPCVKLEFSCQLATGSDVKIEVFFFTEAGTIEGPDGSYPVTDQSMKFNVELSNWVWCSETVVCESPGKGPAAIGVSLELDISVTSKEQAQMISQGNVPPVYSMGGGAQMRLSKKIKVDNGAWTDIVNGGPYVDTQGKKSTVTIKFPTFTTTALYDPDITYTYTPPEPTSTGSGSGSGSDSGCASCDDAAEDYDLHAGGLWANILGQSGKIDLAPSPDPSNHPDRIRIQIEALRELDADGTKIGSGGNIKHSFNSFATQSFTFGSMTETTFPAGTGVPCVKLEFSCQLATGSVVKIEVFLFTEEGNIEGPDGPYDVTDQSMKFNVELSNWVWCSETVVCEGPGKGPAAIGVSLELDISVTSKGQAQMISQGNVPPVYSMGGGAQMRLSKKIKVDNGAWTDIVNGGPYVDTQGKKSTVTIKFPTFTTTALYDPDITFPHFSTSGISGNVALPSINQSDTLLAQTCVPRCAETREWKDLNALNRLGMMRTGGLGPLMIVDQLEVWMCVKAKVDCLGDIYSLAMNVTSPHHDELPEWAMAYTEHVQYALAGGANLSAALSADSMCYVHHEDLDRFLPWAPNSILKLHT